MKRSALAMLAALLTVAQAALGQSERALSVEQIALADTRPSEQDFTIAATLGNASGSYRIGETVDLSIRLDRDAYLLVLNVDEAGAVTRLYPNAYQTEPLVAGGTDLKIPGTGARIVVAGPPGVELIKIIASEKPVPLEAAAQFVPAGPFATSQPETAGRLARALRVESMAGETASPPPAIEPPPDSTPVVQAPDGESPDGQNPEPGIDIGAWAEMTLRLVTQAQEDTPAAPAPSVPAAEPAFGLVLAADRNTYRPGDAIDLTLTATRPCSAILLSIPAGGDPDLLIPNAGLPALVLQADEEQAVAGAIAGPAAGSQLLLGYCVPTGDTGAAADAAGPESPASFAAAPDGTQPAEARLTVTVAE